MIDTPRLQLVPIDARSLTDLMANQPLRLNDVPIHVPAAWADLWLDQPTALPYTLEALKHDPSLHTLGWWSYFAIHQRSHTLIGIGGFGGKPDSNGTVEISYAVVAPYRRQGFATEMARGLIQFAFSHSAVHQVLAHTLATDNPSNRLLKSLDFQHNGTSHDADEGDVWEWLSRKARP